jgi:serine/threonine-protein kinase
MPESMAVGILLPVLDALEYAHRRGIVHRDIKPGNILFDADGRPYVADFGLAKPKDGPNVTRTNVVMGTPHYLAPEQARGKVLDHRSDIYALSATLYEMLTGARPFSSVDGLEAVIAKLESDPEPARTLRPDLSPALDLALRRGMARKPEDRFQSAAEMAAALARALEFPDEGAPVPEPERHEAEGLFDRAPVVPSTTLEKPRSVQDTYQTEVLVDVLHPIKSPALPAAPELPNSGAKALILTVTGVVLAAAVLAFAFLRGPGEFREAVPEVVPANPSSVSPSASREGGGNDSIPSATDVIPSPVPTASAAMVPATAVSATPRPSPRADVVPPSTPLARPVVPPNQVTDGDQEILSGMPDGCAGVQVAAIVTIDANGAVKGARSLSKANAECWSVAEKFIRSIRFEPARASDGTGVESAPLAISVSLGDKKP